MAINISKLSNELIISFEYSPVRVAKIKSLKVHKLNPDKRIWSVPFTEENLNMLKELFKNEQKNIDFEENPQNQNLFEQMDDQIKLKRYSFKTRKSYISHFKRFSSFLNKDLHEFTVEDVKRYTLFLLDDQKVSHSYINQAISSIKFLCKDVLKQNKIIDFMTRPKKRK